MIIPLPFTVPLEWTTTVLLLIMQFLCCMLIFIVIERIRPIHADQSFTTEKRAELWLMLLNSLVTTPVAHLLLVLLFTYTVQEFIPYQWLDVEIQALPFAIQVFIGVLLLDFKVYIRHRFTHSFLWRTHAVHHSANYINWLTASRLHPNEIIIDTAFTVPVMYILGFSGEGIAIASVIMFFFNLFTHANLNLEYPGFLRYLCSSPNFHRWHHAKLEKEAFNKNFAVVFPFIDMAFGTFYYPKGRLPREYGIYQRPNETPIIQTLWGQISYPFLRTNRDDTGKTKQL